MSHYCEVELEMKGSVEALVKALTQMRSRYNKIFTAQQVEVHAPRQSLRGYQGDVRPQKAHVIIRKRHVGEAANDLGFEKLSSGNWKMHVSEMDGGSYNSAWEKELLSRWAVANLEEEAKAKGWGFSCKYNETTQKAYVTVTQARGW